MQLKDFRKYIKRKLGSPIINIEITDEQLDDAIDDAMQLFYESHYDGVNIGYIIVDIEEGTSSYTLDENIHDVVEILGLDDFSYGNDPLLIKESVQFTPYAVGYSFDLISLEIWRQQLQNLRNMYNREVLFDFNSVTKELKLHVEPQNNTSYALKVYQSDTDLTDLYDDRWLKQYATALAKKQWATNLQKYSGAQMPGGAEFNYGDIMSQAETEIEKLETDLEEKYSEPLDFEVA